MAFKMVSPFKKVEELKEVVQQLKGAVKAHGKQAKMVQKHIDMMESPTKLKDACYRKAKAKYDVFPSAYASGYIAKCRKRGGKIK
jgi:pyrroloquinoline quinone (PQQ) biosynthesis protein C